MNASHTTYRRLLSTLRSRRVPLVTRLVQGALWLGILVGVSPLVRGIFLTFLDEGQGGWALGLSGWYFRASLLVMSIIGLSVHGTVLRGSERGPLSILPVSPKGVVSAQLLGLAQRAVMIVLGVQIASLSLLLEGSPVLWGLQGAVLLGAAALSLVASACTLLGAILVAESPAWAPALDALRGNNPRPQAAIIYALAPSTLLVGAMTLWSSGAAVQLWQGQGGWALLLAPLAVAAALVPAALWIADRSWTNATMVLEEIRARYATLEKQEHALEVYMDWTVRFLPEAPRRWALLALRRGWRQRRGPISGGWLFGCVGAAVGWSASAADAVMAGALAAGAAWAAGWVVVSGAVAESPYLRIWLEESGPRALGRGWAVFAWAQGPLWLAAGAVLMRQGLTEALSTLVVGLAVGGCASLMAALAASRERAKLWTYSIGAVVGSLGVMAVALGGQG